MKGMIGPQFRGCSNESNPVSISLRTDLDEFVLLNVLVCLCWSDLKRLLPSISPDPTELQRAIEVQLLRSSVSAMSKALQQEQRTAANPE